MGAPELHLKPAARPPGPRALSVAGESMRPWLAPGDAVTSARRPPRPGDCVVFLGPGGGLVVHRFYLRLGPWCLTKGDFQLLPDRPLAVSAVTGVVVAARRGGRALSLDVRTARYGGLALAAWAWPCALAYRALQFACWLLRDALDAARLSLPRPLAFLETFPYAFMRASAGIPADALAAALPEALVPAAAGPRPAGGPLDADQSWSGEVRLVGDVVVPRGVTLTLSPGCRVRAAEEKRIHHGARRRIAGSARDADPVRPRLAVYGRLVVAGEPQRPAVVEGLSEVALYGGELEASALRLEGATRGVGAHDGALARLRDCVFEDCGTAVETAGRSRASLNGVQATRVGLVFSSEGESRLSAADAALADCAEAARSAGGARVRLSRVSGKLSGDRALCAEERSWLRALDCAFSGSRDGAVAAGGRLTARRLTASATESAAAARDGGRLSLDAARLRGRTGVEAARGAAFLRDCVVRGRRFGAAVSAGTLSAVRCALGGREAAAHADADAALRLEGCRLRGGHGLHARGDSSATLASCRLSGRDGHGAWLRERARASLSDVVVARAAHAAALVADAAVLEATGLEARGAGLAVEGGTARVSRLSVSGAALAVSAKAGALRLDGWTARGGRAGAAAGGDAALELSDGLCEGLEGFALALAGGARASVERLRVERCGGGADVADRASLEAAAFDADACTGVVLRLRDEARAVLRAARAASCAAGTALVEGRARLELEDSRFEGGGLAATGGALLLRRVAVMDAPGAAVDVAGGAHRLEGCALEGRSPALRAAADASTDLLDCVLSGCDGPALVLAGSARARVERVRVERCGGGADVSERAALDGTALELLAPGGLGLRLRDDARVLLRSASVAGAAGGAALIEGRARLELEDARLEGCGVAATGGAAVLRRVDVKDAPGAGVDLGGGAHHLEGCAIDGPAPAVRAAGDAAATLADCALAGSEGAALVLSGRALLRVDRTRAERCGAGADLDQRASLQGDDFSVLAPAGHGLRLRRESAADLRRLVVTGAGESAVLLEDDASLDLEGGRLESCACGVSAAGGGSRLNGVRLAGHRGAGADLAAGEHALDGCSLERSRRGVFARAAARVRASDCLFSGHEEADAVAGGTASLSLERCRLRAGRAGLLAQDASRASLERCLFEGHAEPAVRLGQTARTDVRRCLFKREWMALLAEDDSALDARDCSVRGGPTGFKLDGRARADLRACGFRDAALDGVWLGERAALRAGACRFRACRVALQRHSASSPDLQDCVYEDCGASERTFA